MMSTASGWSEFAAALSFFLASHALPIRPLLKTRLAAILGGRGFALAYSALSLFALAWLIVAAGRAPYVEIWEQARWQMWVPNLVMPFAVALLAFSVAAPNPLSFGGAHNERFDPERPGVVGLARHPLLLAFALWAFAHVIPNGDLAHIAMFGLLGSFAVFGMPLIDRRKRRALGEARWSVMARNTSLIPFAAWLARGAPTDIRRQSIPRLCAVLALYASAIGLHGPIIGASPWPS